MAALLGGAGARSGGRTQVGTGTAGTGTGTGTRWASTGSGRQVALAADTQVRPPLDDSFWRGGYARVGGGTLRAAADGLGTWRSGGAGGTQTMSHSRALRQRTAATPFGA